MEISNRNENFFVQLVLLKERVVPSPAKRLSDWYWALPTVRRQRTMHGHRSRFQPFVRVSGSAMADSLCLRRGKTLGHGIIPISGGLDRFRPF